MSNDKQLCEQTGCVYARWLAPPSATNLSGWMVGAVELTFGRGRLVIGTLSGVAHGY